MGTTNIQYLALSSAEELRRHKEQWDALDARSSQHPAMLSYAWISNHFKSFVPPGLSWACLIAISKGELVATLPLVFKRRVWPTPHVIAKSPFGDHLNISDMLCTDPNGKDVLSGILDFAFSRYPRLVHIELPRVPFDSPMSNFDVSAPAQWAISRNENSCGKFLPLPDSFSNYEQSFSRNFRNNLKKATNKLVRLKNVEFEFLGPDVDVKKCFKRFCDIESSGWKGRSGTAIGESDYLVDYYTAILQDLQRNRVLEWHFLKCSGHDLAAHMAFRSQERLVLWKLAYNESFSACSPGSQLLRELIRREIDNNKCGEIDLTTDPDWADKWNWVKRPYIQVLVRRRHNCLSTLYLIFEMMRNAARNSDVIRKVWTALRNISRAR